MTANHPEDLVARLTARASSANGNGRPAGGYWPDDAELDRQAATLIISLVGERDALERERDVARQIVRDIHWMAVRYADGRMTYAPSMCNDALAKAYDAGWLNFEIDGAKTPQYARDGMFPEWTNVTAQLELAESTIRNRDETIAAQAVEIEAAKLFGGGYYAPAVTEDTRDYYRVEVARRALASPHQEGTEPK